MTQKIFTYKPQRLKNSNFCFWFFLGSQIFSSIYSCFLSAFCQLSCSKMTDRSTRSGFLNYYLQLRNFFFQKNSRNWKAIKHWAIKIHLFLYSNSYPSYFERKISVSLNWSFAQNLLLPSLTGWRRKYQDHSKTKTTLKIWTWQSTENWTLFFCWGFFWTSEYWNS